MINLIDRLTKKWDGIDHPFLIHPSRQLKFRDIASQLPIDLSIVNPGDSVALIGDFDPSSILTLLRLIDLGAIVVPLTKETKEQHQYFFESGLVDFVIEQGVLRKREHDVQHELIDSLREKNHAGLVVFSTGTSGRPKAILHDLTLVLKKFETPRPALRTISFLPFDHLGGLNTLMHTLFNTGVIIAPQRRTVDSILKTCEEHKAEVLPTTPTFLRMMLMSGAVPDKVPSTLKIITYGTERMDQPTLDELSSLLPNVDFRQTFGMSELGVFRVKSESRNSLYMKVGGEGVETRVVDGVLQIRSQYRMLGYLNALSPFDEDGWYDTKDVVDEKDGFFTITGRTGDVINVGGLKFMASEVERVALSYPDVLLVKAYSKRNPITGEHVEMIVQPKTNSSFDAIALKAFLREHLQPHMLPKRVQIEGVNVGHRFKKE